MICTSLALCLLILHGLDEDAYFPKRVEILGPWPLWWFGGECASLVSLADLRFWKAEPSGLGCQDTELHRRRTFNIDRRSALNSQRQKFNYKRHLFPGFTKVLIKDCLSIICLEITCF